MKLENEVEFDLRAVTVRVRRNSLRVKKRHLSINIGDNDLFNIYFINQFVEDIFWKSCRSFGVARSFIIDSVFDNWTVVIDPHAEVIKILIKWFN